MKNKTLTSIAKGTVIGVLTGLAFISARSQLPTYKAMFADKQPIQNNWRIPVVQHGNDLAGTFEFGIDIDSEGRSSMYDGFTRGSDSVLTKQNFDTYITSTEKFRDVTQDVMDELYK